MKIKICGMKYPNNIKVIQIYEPDFIGFIFYKNSPRYVIDTTLSAAVNLNKNIKKVGVFVNNPIEEVIKIVNEYELNYVQLHGDESVDYAKKLFAENINIIKAFRINDYFDWNDLNIYIPFVSYFLFDTATENYGGSGLKFNWEQLKNYKGETPFFLSGGISIADIQEIKKLNIPQLYALDINSKFEKEPGLKDATLINKMINKVRNEE